MFHHRQRYDNSKLINHIYSTLPMEEFLQGNFSKADQIIDNYRSFLQQCLTEGRKKYIGNHNTVDEYIQAQLAELLPQQESLQNERKEIQSQLEEQKVIIDELAGKFEKECTDPISTAIFKKFKQLECSADKLRAFFYNLEEDYPEQYEKAKDGYKSFRNNPLFQSLNEAYTKKEALIGKRRTNTYNLSHKSNFMNINKQIKDIQNGTEVREIEKSGADHVAYTFMQKDLIGRENLDERDSQTIFMETIASQMIFNRNVPFSTKYRMLENYQDKIGLFGYLMDLFYEFRREEHELGLGFDEVESDHFTHKAEKCIDLIDKVIRTSNEQIYFHHWPITDVEIIHLKTSLLQKKEAPYNLTKDDTLKKIFDRIYDYVEHRDYEAMYEKLWNYNLFEKHQSQNEIFQILKRLRQVMDQEEKTETSTYRDTWNIFKTIQESDHNEDNLLFDQHTLDSMLPPPKVEIPFKRKKAKKVA